MEKIKDLIYDNIAGKSLDQQIDFLNKIKEYLHSISPFKNEPVDFVKWVKSDIVVANDYNPNKVAPPEMELLEISIMNDGFTQPVVTFPNEKTIEVVDGFHRNRVAKESEVVKERIKGYLPTVIIRKEQNSKNNRIASTIRHNRARGKHVVDAMSEIVLELKNRNWKNSRIAKELGMDEEEILRLCQITGLEDIFKDDDFSKSWNVEDSYVDEFEPLTDKITEIEREENLFTTVNTSDPDRIFHTYDKWECYKAGFYNTKPPQDLTKEDCINLYAEFLTDENQFRDALMYIINNWKNSCEHYLTNKAMNRIAWLGQAALCHAKGVSSEFRSGFHLLSESQQQKANLIAHEYLNKWLEQNKYEKVTYDEALSKGRQMEIY
ncbi:MAG: ParB N-terminal domain-containing protein [PVC group bacterium]|nr:ParB N-terminal domain-containing protein [PVC group bacterium]